MSSSAAADAARARESIESLVRARVASPTPLAATRDVTFTFDQGGALAITVRLRRGRVELVHGRVRKPTTTILADEPTMRAVLTGELSGVDAYLAGKLRARGSIALALELDALFEHPPRPAHFPRTQRRVVSEIETFYVEAGQGPPVVLIHGLGATSASMLPTLGDLCRDHRVIAVDLPGFGESGKPLRRYHSTFYARWIVDLLDALGIHRGQRAHLIGNSMGGRVALEVALRMPERVDRLALFAPSLAFRRFRQLVPIARLLAPELAVVPMLIPRLQVILTLRSLFADSSRVPTPWYDAAADEFLRVFSSPRGRIAFFSAAKQIYLEDAVGERGFWDRLPSLSRPALFLFGDRDRLVPKGFARHVQEAVPSARVEVMRDCGHVPQFEWPIETHARVRTFLGGA